MFFAFLGVFGQNLGVRGGKLRFSVRFERSRRPADWSRLGFPASRSQPPCSRSLPQVLGGVSVFSTRSVFLLGALESSFNIFGATSRLLKISVMVLGQENLILGQVSLLDKDLIFKVFDQREFILVFLSKSIYLIRFLSLVNNEFLQQYQEGKWNPMLLLLWS